MNFRTSFKILLKLVYWLLAGLFFTTGIVLVLLYIGTIERKTESKVVDDQSGIQISGVRQVMTSNVFRVSGLIENISARELRIAQVEINVFQGSQLIDQCYSRIQDKVAPGTALPFLAECEELPLAKLTSPVTFTTRVRQATFAK